MVRFNAIADHREDRQELSSFTCFHANNQRWMLRLGFDNDPRNVKLNVSALNEIKSYPQVDTLYLPTLCLHNQGTMFALQELISKEDRPWKVTLDFDAEQALASFKPVIYEIVSLLDTVPILALKGWMAQDFSPILAEQLAALTTLEQLDLERFPLRPNFVVSLYEYFPSLCQKIPHIHLSLEGTQAGDTPLPISFSPVAVKHLQSICISVKNRIVLAEAFQWLRAVCDSLSNLECLELEFVGVPGSDLGPFVELMSTCIASPTCPWTKLSLLFLRLQGPSIPSSVAQSLYQSLGRNRSLDAVKLRGMNAFPKWTDMCSHLSNKTCMIRHLSLGYWEKDRAPDPGTVDDNNNHISKELESLLRWQVQMRPSRLVTVSISPLHTVPGINKIRFVSRLHERWSQGQDHRTSTGVPLSAMMLSRPFWVYALQSADESQDPTLRDVALDAMYHLLQLWLSGESELPAVATGSDG